MPLHYYTVYRCILLLIFINTTYLILLDSFRFFLIEKNNLLRAEFPLVKYVCSTKKVCWQIMAVFFLHSLNSVIIVHLQNEFPVVT